MLFSPVFSSINALDKLSSASLLTLPIGSAASAPSLFNNFMLEFKLNILLILSYEFIKCTPQAGTILVKEYIIVAIVYEPTSAIGLIVSIVEWKPRKTFNIIVIIGPNTGIADIKFCNKFNKTVKARSNAVSVISPALSNIFSINITTCGSNISIVSAIINVLVSITNLNFCLNSLFSNKLSNLVPITSRKFITLSSEESNVAFKLPDVNIFKPK